ncbi:hypothetical protein V8E36_004840 [Tilletia maclaganii]
MAPARLFCWFIFLSSLLSRPLLTTLRCRSQAAAQLWRSKAWTTSIFPRGPSTRLDAILSTADSAPWNSMNISSSPPCRFGPKLPSSGELETATQLLAHRHTARAEMQAGGCHRTPTWHQSGDSGGRCYDCLHRCARPGNVGPERSSRPNHNTRASPALGPTVALRTAALPNFFATPDLDSREHRSRAGGPALSTLSRHIPTAFSKQPSQTSSSHSGHLFSLTTHSAIHIQVHTYTQHTHTHLLLTHTHTDTDKLNNTLPGLIFNRFNLIKARSRLQPSTHSSTSTPSLSASSTKSTSSMCCYIHQRVRSSISSSSIVRSKGTSSRHRVQSSRSSGGVGQQRSYSKANG